MMDEDTSTATASAATAPATPEASAATTAELAVTEEQVREALHSVIDPEIGLDMVSLGLLYGVKIDGSKVNVTMTLTSPACPVGPPPAVVILISNLSAVSVASSG